MALLVRDTRIICAAFHIETEQESNSLLGVGKAACDAVDGSSTRHVSALDVGAVKAPTIGGAIHANGHDNRSRHCQIGLPGAWR